MIQARNKSGTWGHPASVANDPTQPLELSQLKAMERGIDRRIKQWQDKARAKNETLGHPANPASGGRAPLATPAPPSSPAPTANQAPSFSQAPTPDAHAKSGTWGHSDAPPNTAPTAPATLDPALLPLPEKKQLALEALLVGKSETDAAAVAGVTRRTIYRWKQDDDFKTRLCDSQTNLCTRTREFMAGLAPVAVDVIGEALAGMNVNAALQLLKSLQLVDDSKYVEVDNIHADRQVDPAVAFTHAPQTPWEIKLVAPAADGARDTTPPASAAADVALLTVESQSPPEPPELSEMTPAQQRVASSILAGNTTLTAANTEHVPLGVIHDWLRRDETFQRAIVAGRHEQLFSLRCRLLELAAQAAVVLRHALVVKRDLRVAITLLKALRVLR